MGNRQSKHLFDLFCLDCARGKAPSLHKGWTPNGHDRLRAWFTTTRSLPCGDVPNRKDEPKARLLKCT